MNITQTFYDSMASQYDKLFQDWQATTVEQAKILDKLFGREGFGKSAKLLDCAAEFSRYVKEHGVEMTHQSLSDAMAHFGLAWEGVAHNSLADTHACRLVFQTLFPNLYESEVT